MAYSTNLPSGNDAFHFNGTDDAFVIHSWPFAGFNVLLIDCANFTAGCSRVIYLVGVGCVREYNDNNNKKNIAS